MKINVIVEYKRIPQENVCKVAIENCNNQTTIFMDRILVQSILYVIFTRDLIKK
jgi:hypothetical protein